MTAQLTPTARPLDDTAADRRPPPWGMLAAIDLFDCSERDLASANAVRRFVPALVRAIGMRTHGPLRLERFGSGRLAGWSAMQFIETSTIVVHADEVGGRLFVDVFSCRPFDPRTAARVAVDHFGGTASFTLLRR